MTTDLLGCTIADPPPMNAPLPWRVWQVNDVTDWVMARSAREAAGCFVEWCASLGDARTEDELRRDGDLKDPRELSDVELQKMCYRDGGPTGCTFAEELARMAAGATAPNFFASTEY
jgi:hypothetical protein